MADIAVQRATNLLGITDVEAYRKERELLHLALTWFESMRKREQKRADFFEQAKEILFKESFTEAVKWVARITFLTLWGGLVYLLGHHAIGPALVRLME